MSRGIIPARSLYGADELVRDHGGDAAAIAAQVRLPPEAFEDPDLPVALDAAVEFLELAAQHCRREDLGLLLAQRQDLSVVGPVYAMMSFAETISEALYMLVNFMGVHSAGLIISSTKVPDGLLISYDIGAKEVEHDRQAMELGLALLANFVRVQLGRPWHPNYVQFRHSRPKSLASHARIFGPNVLFEQDHNGLCIDQGTLHHSLGPANKKARQVMERVLRDRAAFDDHGVLPRAEAAIRALLPYTGGCTIDIVAKYLGTSVRTLQRNLARSATSFDQLRDQVRLDLAEKYLTQSTMSLAEIADVLGYSQPSAFTRAFKRQKGCAPLKFRQSARSTQAQNPDTRSISQ